ncbi:MAG: hypothetical protein FD119_114 [Stygiobacter sp.]|nr:MAG: hypothetical protein FD119_114 [Stygiobacter sp.]
MKLRLDHLQLRCRHSVEMVPFAERVSFFHGEMSVGKSSIPALVDFCLGGRFPGTPAIKQELVSVALQATMGGNTVLIERVAGDASTAQVTWETSSGETYSVSAPIKTAASEPIFGEDVFNFSDLVLHLVGSRKIKVRKRSYDLDSQMVRLSIRDILKFVYLDQDDLDSDFFLLDVPIRKEKSKDALHYFVGYMSERLNELQGQLQQVRQDQRTRRESVNQVYAFLKPFGFESEARITAELDGLNAEARSIMQELESLKAGYRPETHLGDEDRRLVRTLAAQAAQLDDAIAENEKRIGEQEALAAELMQLKMKAARVDVSHRVLDGVEFECCPRCGSGLAPKAQRAEDSCYVCQTPAAAQPRGETLTAEVVRQDLDARIADLKDSVVRHRRATAQLKAKHADVGRSRRDVEERVATALTSYESDFLARSRAGEQRLAVIRERCVLLDQVRAMPAEIERLNLSADGLSTEIDGILRRIEEEQAKLVGAEANLTKLEHNYAAILRDIQFPGFIENDQVILDRKSLIPKVWPRGRMDAEFDFFTVGSGGKKILMKIAFALALHKTAAEVGLPVPPVLIIDSPMKNITPDVNPEIFTNFYGHLYALLGGVLADWQIILVDQTLAMPPANVAPSLHRLMLRNNQEHPPLISYYQGF